MDDTSFESIWDGIEEDPIKREEMKELSQKLIQFREMVRRNDWDLDTTASHFQLSLEVTRVLMEGRITDIQADWIPEIPSSGVRPI